MTFKKNLGLPVASLVAGALVLGVLAWREGRRASATAEVLLKDYAAFVAEKFVQASKDRYLELIGLRTGPTESKETPFALLRQALSGGAIQPPPAVVRYFFIYEDGRLEFSGGSPTDLEHVDLLLDLSAFDPACAPREVVPFGRLGASHAWAGILETDERGKARRIAGLRLDDAEAVRSFFVPVVASDDPCECPNSILPEGLAGIRDTQDAASFILRHGDGTVLYRSEPQYETSPRVRQSLSSETPFHNWSVEVAMNPDAVRPLLPYGGSGVPLVALAVLGAFVLGASALAFRALRRERELFQLQRDFVSNVSHELKAPLSRIRLFNELLSDERVLSKTKRERYRGVIDRECRRLSFLVERVLDFARSARGGPTYDKTPLDLRRVVEDALESFRAAEDGERFALSTELEDVPPVLGDARALERVLVNLLDNAVKYSPPGGRVDVHLSADGDRARVSVRDQGYGIPKDALGRIWEEFFRVERGEAQRASGSGLGLALVRRTVEAHGGSVCVSSEIDRGSTFVVELPCNRV